MSDVMRQLPQYKSHKKVWALKIAEVRIHNRTPGEAGFSATIVPADDGYAPFDVPAEYVSKHKPEAGGYFVQYSDGYASFSPAEAFESGYTRI